jgi:leucyl/phenylalanyl-tRNA--protein transferase
MPVFELTTEYPVFPPVKLANPDGLVAIGGKLNREWILEAYRKGLFPWFGKYDPIMWWSPDPRAVLFPDEIHVQKSMRPYLNSERYTFRLNENFPTVIRRCATIPRGDHDGTWITPDMIDAYEDLHYTGIAHSAEIYEDGILVGGLYGLSMGSAFFGESMFSDRANVSKLALIRLCNHLNSKGFTMIDCQVYSQHLERLGAREIDRTIFIELLNEALKNDISID